MTFFLIITLLVLGFLAAAERIQAMAPGTKDLISFLRQSEGWIGIVSIVLGIIWLFRVLRWIKYFNLYLFLGLLSALVMIALGFLYAQNVLRGWTKDNASINDNINKVVDKLAPIKEPLGIAAIVLGVVDLLMYVF